MTVVATPDMVAVRDGRKMACHRSSPEHPVARLFFLHGSTYNARRYAAIAKTAMQAGIEVILLDRRGHGMSEGERGDVDYIGQLEDDLADIIQHYGTISHLPTIVGGHSGGSMIVLRYLNKYGESAVDGLIIVAPAISRSHEAFRFDRPDSARDYRMRYFRDKRSTNPPPESALRHIPVMNGKLFWAAWCLPFLRHRTVLRFPASEKMAQMEGRVLNYSYNMVSSQDPKNYVEAFSALRIPTLLTIGENDEFLNGEFLPTLFNWHMHPDMDKELIVMPKANHLSIINAAGRIIPRWINERFSQKKEDVAA